MKLTVPPNILDDCSQELLNQLIARFPLVNTPELKIFAERTRSSIPVRASCGEGVNGVRITILFGKAYNPEELPSTLAHEYRHAMQLDMGKCNEDTHGRKMCEIDADLFAIQQISQFKGISLEEAYHCPLSICYSQTHEFIKQQGSLEAAVANPPSY